MFKFTRLKSKAIIIENSNNENFKKEIEKILNANCYLTGQILDMRKEIILDYQKFKLIML